MSDLWCMHIQGPDDLHAAPDFWTALAWAAELNGFIAERAAKGSWKSDGSYPLSQAVVRRWTGTPESHAVQCEIELLRRTEHEAKRKEAALAAKAAPDEMAVSEREQKIALAQALDQLIYAAQGGNAMKSNIEALREIADYEGLRELDPRLKMIAISSLRQRASMIETALAEARKALASADLSAPAPSHPHAAQGIEARKGRDEGSVHESPVAKGDAP